MVYLSHPVRRLREEPIEGESVTLLVRVEGSTLDDVADALADLGTVEERMRFGTVKVTISQTAVDAVCDLAGIEAVETAKTLALDPAGAGEDVEFDGR